MFKVEDFALRKLVMIFKLIFERCFCFPKRLDRLLLSNVSGLVGSRVELLQMSL